MRHNNGHNINSLGILAYATLATIINFWCCPLNYIKLIHYVLGQSYNIFQDLV